MSDKKLPYYTTSRIDTTKAIYRMILGERSNGKTTAVLFSAVKYCWENNCEMAYIRRWQDEIRGQRGDRVFSGLVALDFISLATDGVWSHVVRDGTSWYFARYEDGECIKADSPFCCGFNLSADEHEKGISYPNIKIVVFDEFVARRAYIVDEFVAFMNLLSTIIRTRDDVIIYMIGNSISKYCPYFEEMGLKHIKEMKPGDIEIYTYNERELSVAVEFSDFKGKKKPSNKYFAFDNPKLNMITGTGSVWEIGSYPHLPEKYTPKNILYKYFIEFDRELFECHIVHVSHKYFTFIFPKTTPLKPDTKNIIFTDRIDGSLYRRARIDAPVDEIGRIIWQFFRDKQVYYATNAVGDMIDNFLDYTKKAGR